MIFYHLEDATLPRAAENPYKVTITIEGQSVQMEIDEQTYQELWPTAPLQKSSVQLKAHH